jgi:hypothetical protein
MYIAIQHFVLVWAGSLTLNAVHAFPPKYCDILHSSARHLGYWDRVGANAAQTVQCVEYVAFWSLKNYHMLHFLKTIPKADGALKQFGNKDPLFHLTTLYIVLAATSTRLNPVLLITSDFT